MDKWEISSVLDSIVEVNDFHNGWVLGRLVLDPQVVVEISFEGLSGFSPIPNTPITYMGMWKRGFGSYPHTRSVFEFQLGVIVQKPHLTDWAELIYPVIQALTGYRINNGMLLKVDDATINA